MRSTGVGASVIKALLYDMISFIRPDGKRIDIVPEVEPWTNNRLIICNKCGFTYPDMESEKAFHSTDRHEVRIKEDANSDKTILIASTDLWERDRLRNAISDNGGKTT